MIPDDLETFQTAIAFARSGWRILPLHDVASGRCSCGKSDCVRSAGKHPLFAKWGESATTDEATIRNWFHKRPAMNYGIATGPESGIWIFDVEQEGLATLEKLECDNGKLPTTFTVRSGGGGKHFFFRWPTGGVIVPSRGVPGQFKIDTKGDGGQVVGAGSKSLKGKYAVIADEPVVDAPEWLIDLVTQPAIPKSTAPNTTPIPTTQSTITASTDERIRRARACLDKIPGGVSGQGGSDPCYWAARVLVRGFALDRSTARQLMAEYSARCSPPWSAKEIEHKLDDAETKPFDKPVGWLLDAPRDDRRAATSASVGGVPATAAAEPERPRFEFIDSAQFATGDYRASYLVNRVVTRGEPGVIGGPIKILKTTNAVDLAISVATGTPFLGHFDTPHAVTSAIVSGESGRSTLQKIAERVCDAKGITLDSIGERLFWCTDIPRLDDDAGMTIFAGELAKRGVEFVLLDPLYLMLGDVNAASVFDAGSLLRNVGAMLIKNGITPFFLHHARKVMPIGQPMELADLSHSGLPEFVRQWILLNRETRYEGDGKHRLLANIGGSNGHGGQFLIDVDEGTLNDDFSGRYWSVNVTNMADMPKATAEDRDAKKTADRKAKNAAKIEKFLKELDAELATGVPAVAATKFRTIHGWQYADLKAVTECLMIDGIIEQHPFEFVAGNNAKQQTTGYRRPVPKTQSELEFPNSQFENEQPVFSDAQPAELAVPGVGGEQPVEQPVWLSPLKGDTNGQPAVPQHHRENQKPKGKKTAKSGRQKKTGCSPDVTGAA